MIPPNLDLVFTQEEYVVYCEEQAQRMCGISWEELCKKVDNGELYGTLAETRCKLLRALL